MYLSLFLITQLSLTQEVAHAREQGAHIADRQLLSDHPAYIVQLAGRRSPGRHSNRYPYSQVQSSDNRVSGRAMSLLHEFPHQGRTSLSPGSPRQPAAAGCAGASCIAPRAIAGLGDQVSNAPRSGPRVQAEQRQVKRSHRVARFREVNRSPRRRAQLELAARIERDLAIKYRFRAFKRFVGKSGLEISIRLRDLR